MENSGVRPYIILGIDLGIGSCGWALIDTANGRIVHLGSHLWDPPQEPKSKISKAKTRRDARSSRRAVKRTADRKKHCLELFREEGLVPEDAGREWLQTAKGDMSPLESRIAALDHVLDDRAWAQALYNIASRRGYIPHGEDAEDDGEEGKVKKALKENAELMEGGGYRTIEEALCNMKRSRNRDGDYSKCVTHSQLVDEARKLFEAQRGYGNMHAGVEFEGRYLAEVGWEKDVTDRDARVYDTVGPCMYGLDGKRAAKAAYTFQLCRAYEQVCNVRIVRPDGSEESLAPETRQEIIATLFSPTPLKRNRNCEVKYSRLRKMLDLGSLEGFKGIPIQDEGKLHVSEPRAWKKLRSALSEGLMTRMAEDRALADGVGSALAYASSEDSLREQLGKLDLDDGEIDEIANGVPYRSKVFKGYGDRGMTALDMLVGAFEESDEVVTIYDAEKETGLYELRTSDRRERGYRLPEYRAYDPTCKNPVVLRAMGRLQKVVNAVIGKYGMPDEIHIELARELKHSKKEKAAIARGNAMRRNQRAAYRETIAELLQCDESDVTGKQLRKYGLWVEQENRDLYTGEPIDCMRMLQDQTYTEIDHILPYSRSCDDGQNNKTLTFASKNREKGDRSPFEWLTETGEWDGYEARVRAAPSIPYRKKLNLLERKLAEKQAEFIERNLTDTRYATKAALGYIENCLAFPEDTGRKRHVLAVAGGATATLTRAWGLKKDREKNDCHHALDAAVVAACDESAIIRVAKASEAKRLMRKDERKRLFADTEPWPGFAREAEKMAEACIPTRMIDRSLSGRLYEDTVYRFEGYDETGAYALLSAKGKTRKSSNFTLRDDGSAVLPDKIAFTRLWWDPDAKVRGRKEPGSYLIEPVYYADVAAIRAGTYVPRSIPRASERRTRDRWPEIPPAAMARKPVELRMGNALQIGSELARFKTVMISTNQWVLADIRKLGGGPLKGLPLSQIGPNTEFQVIDEDILGLCYGDLEK